jgi:hypothetical protein
MPPLRGLCHLLWDHSANMARLRRSTASKIDARHIRGRRTFATIPVLAIRPPGGNRRMITIGIKNRFVLLSVVGRWTSANFALCDGH